MLRRTAGPSEIAGWVRVYAAQGRTAVTDGIWFSLEARRIRTGAYYQEFLGRAADPAGLAMWVDVGRAHGEGEVRRGVLGSAEYRNRSLLRFV